MKKIFLLLILILLTTTIYSQEENKETSFIGDSIFSLDFSCILKNIDNKGFGFGLSYEKLFFNCWSVKGNFSHIQFWVNDEKVKVVTAESTSLSTFFYPGFKKFNYFYFGGGCSTDFIQNGSYGNNTITYLFPQIGWKQNIKNIVFLDIFYRYDIPVSSGQATSYEEVLTKQRNGICISTKVNLSKIYNMIKEKSRK